MTEPPRPHAPGGPIAAIDAALGGLRAEIESGGPLVPSVAAECGLHLQSLALDLRQWVDGLEASAMARLVASSSRPLGRGRILTLAPGNLPIVAAECAILGLLAGVRHDLALSTRATHLTQALVDALRPRWPDLDDQLALHVWRRLDTERRNALLGAADRVVAYGSADTVEWVAARARPDSVVVPHGPSVAVGLIRPDRLDAERRRAALAGLAEDVFAFDQRGCRSPHILFVLGDGAATTEIVEELAGSHFPAASQRRPRGPLPERTQVDLYLDGLTSAALGRVIDGPDWRITAEDRPRVARPSPLGRTLRVVRIDDAAALVELLHTLPAPISCFATPEDFEPPIALDASADHSGFGRLQTPPFDRLHDGRHRLDELLPV